MYRVDLCRVLSSTLLLAFSDRFSRHKEVDTITMMCSKEDSHKSQVSKFQVLLSRVTSHEITSVCVVASSPDLFSERSQRFKMMSKQETYGAISNERRWGVHARPRESTPRDPTH